jgi:hypothetical protein
VPGKPSPIGCLSFSAGEVNEFTDSTKLVVKTSSEDLDVAGERTLITS